MPAMGLRELEITWEMLVKFGEAIRTVSWPGEFVQAVGIGMEIIKNMEVQYRAQVEIARKNVAAVKQNAKEQINRIGGKVNEIEPSIAG